MNFKENGSSKLLVNGSYLSFLEFTYLQKSSSTDRTIASYVTSRKINNSRDEKGNKALIQMLPQSNIANGYDNDEFLQ